MLAAAVVPDGTPTIRDANGDQRSNSHAVDSW
jgi:hypothetical protein